MESATIRKCLIGVVLTGVILVGYMAISWISPAQTPLVFVTGEKEGLYRELGDAIATEIQHAHPKIKIQVVSTAGSLDNAKRLQNNPPISPWFKMISKPRQRSGASQQSTQNCFTFFATKIQGFKPFTICRERKWPWD